jgi:hypothetical protein
VVETKINTASGQRFLTNGPRDPDELKAMYEHGNHEWRARVHPELGGGDRDRPRRAGLNKFDPARVKIKYHMITKKNLEGNLGNLFLVTRVGIQFDHVARHCQAREPELINNQRRKES